MKKTLLLLTSLALGAALNVQAQNTNTDQDYPCHREGGRFGPQGRGPGGPPHGLPPLLAILDADKDGKLSAEEISGASAALLALDANQDGILLFEELCVGPRPGGKGMGPGKGQGPGQGQGPGKGKGFGKGKGGPMGPSPLMQALDTDADGQLSSAEIQDAPASLLALDKNQDGQITPEDLRPRDGRGRGEGNRPGPPEQQ